MATEKLWGDYTPGTPRGYILTDDILLLSDASGLVGANVLGDSLLARRSAGAFYSGSGAVSDTDGTGLNQGQLFLYDSESPSSGLQIGYRFQTGITEYGRIQARNSVGATNLVLQGGGGRLLVGSSAEYSGFSARAVISYAGGGTEHGLTMKPASNTTTAINFLNAAGSGVGSITISTSATAFNTSSDYRLKVNLRPLTGSLARIRALPVYLFDWADGSDSDVRGFLAHEYGQAIPGAATGEKDAMREEEYEIEPARKSGVLGPDGEPVMIPAVMGRRMVPHYQGVDQAKAVPDLVCAVKELAAIVDGALADIAELKARS